MTGEGLVCILGGVVLVDGSPSQGGGVVRFAEGVCVDQEPILSAHAEKRLRQRGYRERDIQTMMSYGTVCAEAVVLTAENVSQAIETKKREIQDLERLRGTAMVVQEWVVVTMYRPDRHRWRRFLSRRCRPSGEGR